MKTIIITSVKNKSGNHSDVNNDIPIALVTVVSNSFENILLELIEAYLSATYNQFGFKKGHSTDHCICVLTMLYSITETITALSILVFQMLLKLSTWLTTGHFLRNVLIDAYSYCVYALFYTGTEHKRSASNGVR